jgi:hypothetical protein
MAEEMSERSVLLICNYWRDWPASLLCHRVVYRTAALRAAVRHAVL